ncbi:hypothetical protein FKP32DRAFT_38583 [Trametes sanguinea]|nr:hypothetical protein FKP32DRAFT_38583 [Trametes sanguinea]
MALNAQYSAAFQHIARQINDFFDANSRWFNATTKDDEMLFTIGGRSYMLQKLGYTQLGNFRGIGYALMLLKLGSSVPELQWTFWVANPGDLAANKRALIAGIYAAINDCNAGKLSWTIDAPTCQLI